MHENTQGVPRTPGGTPVAGSMSGHNAMAPLQHKNLQATVVGMNPEKVGVCLPEVSKVECEVASVETMTTTMRCAASAAAAAAAIAKIREADRCRSPAPPCTDPQDRTVGAEAGESKRAQNEIDAHYEKKREFLLCISSDSSARWR